MSNNVDNNSGFRPLADKILIQLKKKEEKTEGGIIIPDSKESAREHIGQTIVTLIAKGQDAFAYIKDAPEIGDKLVVARYAGQLVKGEEDEEYRLCPDNDVLGVAFK